MPGGLLLAFPVPAVAGGGSRPWVVLPEALLVETVGLKVTVRCGLGGVVWDMLDLCAINGVASVAVDDEAIVLR